jgi:hypothetical protein
LRKVFKNPSARISKPFFFQPIYFKKFFLENFCAFPAKGNLASATLKQNFKTFSSISRNKKQMTTKSQSSV